MSKTSGNRLCILSANSSISSSPSCVSLFSSSKSKVGFQLLNKSRSRFLIKSTNIQQWSFSILKEIQSSLPFGSSSLFKINSLICGNLLLIDSMWEVLGLRVPCLTIIHTFFGLQPIQISCCTKRRGKQQQNNYHHNELYPGCCWIQIYKEF